MGIGPSPLMHVHWVGTLLRIYVLVRTLLRIYTMIRALLRIHVLICALVRTHGLIGALLGVDVLVGAWLNFHALSRSHEGLISTMCRYQMLRGSSDINNALRTTRMRILELNPCSSNLEYDEGIFRKIHQQF